MVRALAAEIQTFVHAGGKHLSATIHIAREYRGLFSVRTAQKTSY
jgi:hypothetical protein